MDSINAVSCFDVDSFFDKVDDHMVSVNGYVAEIYEQFVGFFGNVFSDVMQENAHIWENSPTDECVLFMDDVLQAASMLPDFIYALVLDYGDVRNLCAGVISFERQLDRMQPQGRKVARAGTAGTGSKKGSYGQGCVDLSVAGFLPDTWKYIIQSAVDRWNGLNGTRLCSTAHDRMDRFTDNDMDSVGIILSNYGYLARALFHNGKFYDDVTGVLSRMQSEYHVKPGRVYGQV